MSDTPETDAAEWRDEMCDPPNVVESDFARRLERQRDALQKKLDEKEKAHQVTRDTARRLSAEKHQAASQRDTYAETLSGIFELCRDYEKLNADRLAELIRERHPEIWNSEALPPPVGSGEGSNETKP